jgi:glycosyltransferase involved in cell wall biosynthesis
MHVLFFHQNFPGQFGQIARYLVEHHDFECTFICQAQRDSAGPSITDWPAGVQYLAGVVEGPATAPAAVEAEAGVRIIRYPAPEHDVSGFDGRLRHGLAIKDHLKRHAHLRPDLAVSSGAFGATTFLGDLFGCPVIHCFDYYYQPNDSYLHFRPEFPPTDGDLFRARFYNAHVLLDLESCTAGYSPTQWQRSLLPARYRNKVACIFDGVDRAFWRRRALPRRMRGEQLPAETRIVTYVARGLEALRGFDIFMRMAGRICRARSDVRFVVVGSEDFYHGPDLRYIQARSFLQHVWEQGDYDPRQFMFLGRVPSAQLLEVLCLSDLHVYLTAPFVLSWSLFNALACGCTVLASDTAPVREVIEHERNGLLGDFSNVEGLTGQALRVLENPAEFRGLGQAGMALIDAKYALARTVPAMVELFGRVMGTSTPAVAVSDCSHD